MEPQEEMIAIESVCTYYAWEPDFLASLEQHGLIRLAGSGAARSVFADDLVRVERFARLHYELHINVEGIDALEAMLERVEALQAEVRKLKKARS